MEGQEVARGSGILLAVSSLPSEYGIGTLGDAAFHFVDLLVDLKQKYWQVLPVGPTSFGDSPYQSLSAFAGNPYLIDLDQLVREKLLTPEEIQSYYWGTQKSAIDYAALFENRTLVLQKAFGRFDEHEPEMVYKMGCSSSYCVYSDLYSLRIYAEILCRWSDRRCKGLMMKDRKPVVV